MQPRPPRAPVPSVPRADVDFDALAKSLKPLSSPVRLRLLHLATRPQYLEELAASLKMSRQGVRKHLDELVGLGVLRKQLGRREFGPVTEYALNHPRLFHLHTEFGKLGALKPAGGPDEAARTLDHAPTADPAARGARPGGNPRLVLVRGLSEGQAFPLEDQPGRAWMVGRGREADVRLDYDPFLSNRHAEVRREARGFRLVDAFSRNGTHLNWRRLERGEAAPLERGDVVGVGKSLLVFQVRAGP